MNVIVAGSEALAAFLGSIIRPGYEVVSLGDDIDSPKIDGLIIIVDFAQFNSGKAAEALLNNAHRMSEGSQAKIIVV